MKYVDLAKEEGGQIVYGGNLVQLADAELKSGYFMQPTIITGLSPKSRCMQEEIFGPVVCVCPFKDEKQAIDYANDVEYGLSATIWSKDVKQCHRVAKKLQCGYVWVNCWMVRDLNMPFGGHKASGLGREGWPYSLQLFTEEKTVCIAY